MEHEAAPCQYLKKNTKIVDMVLLGDRSQAPNPIIEVLIKQSPKTRISFLLILVNKFPIIGEIVIVAKEFMQNIHPINDISISHSLSFKGKNGTTSEFQLLASIFADTKHSSTQFAMI